MTVSRDLVFAFIGGAVIGAAATATAMIKSGYIRPTPEQQELLNAKAEEEKRVKIDQDQDVAMTEDKPSYQTHDKVDTVRVRYDKLEEKPDLDAITSKYTESKDDSEPESEDDDEEENGEDPLEREVADAMVDEDVEMGHVIKKLIADKPDKEIYLVHQEHAGEVYLLEDLVYYKKDDILTDLTDLPFDNPESVIGDALDYFGQFGADEDKVFVRNHTLGVEYEITLNLGRFSDHLYGVEAESEADGERGGRYTTKKLRAENEE